MNHYKKTDDISVGIKTFFRPVQLERCLKSLLLHNWSTVIVADDGKIENDKKKVYDKYSKKLPLKILYLDFDAGLAAGRNRIVEECKTDFLLMIDDDHIVPENIHILKAVIDDNKELGGSPVYGWIMAIGIVPPVILLLMREKR